MSIPRFFMEDALPQDCAPGDEVALPFSAKELQHMMVRRLEVGEHIACCAAGGFCWEVELTALDAEHAVGKVIEPRPAERVPNLTLVQGISKGDRMGQTIRQTTELGIAHVIPFLSERTIVRLRLDQHAAKGDRWRRIALSAAKQSGRTVLPVVEDPTSLEDICEELSFYDRVVIAWEEADKTADGKAAGIGDALEGCDFDTKVALIIGPEGGLTKNEVETFRALGDMVHIVSLGPLILRTETAGTVATALCIYELGGLGNNKRNQ